MSHGRGDIWVFGYGSLMWQPGFDHLDAEPALLRGYHRAFCVYSRIYRGTAERPGLVLGLDYGGSCRGVAFRVHAERAGEVLDTLHEREMPTDSYRPRLLPVRTAHAAVRATAYVVNRHSRDYVGKLGLARTVALVRQGEGTMGRCRDYLERTVHHLERMGHRDLEIHRLLEHVRAAE